MNLFDLSDPLEACIASGNLPATLDALREMSPAQRHERRAGLLQLGKRLYAANGGDDEAPTEAQRKAHTAALLLCGTAKDAAQLWVDEPLLVDLCREFQPRALDGLADELLERSPQRIRAVQALIAAGLAMRPNTTAYALGLISLPWVLRDASKLRAAMAADTGLAAALLRVLTIEGTADVSLASSDKYNHVPELNWATIFIGLADSGVTTRAELLSLTLAALENDWPQYRSGWFSRFHVALAPDVASMRAHLPRYLALCHSRIPPTVGLALEALSRIDADQPLDSMALLGALRPVLTGAVKTQIEAALKLMDRIVERDCGQRTAATLLIATGLMLDSATLQKSILRRATEWGVDDAGRARLRQFGAGIAAVNRPAWQRLIGDEPATTSAAEVPREEAAPGLRDALHAERRIEPIGDIDQLVECVAHVFENDTDADAFERAMAGVVTLAPFNDMQRRALAPVLKRAAKVRKPVAIALAKLLLSAVEGRELLASPGVDAGGNASPVQAVLLGRINDLIAVARQGAGVVPLSTPTHRSGFISPAAMVERVEAHQRKGVQSPLTEQVLGLLRLAPRADEAALANARGLGDAPLSRALRYALGDAINPGPEHELFAAAARIRHPGVDDPLLLSHQGDLGPDAARAAHYAWRVHSRESKYADTTYHFHDLVVETAVSPQGVTRERLAVLRHPPPGDARAHYRWWSFGGVDEGAICWSAALLPSCPDAFFAEGARAVGNNLDWWEAQWHNAAYLRGLLEPSAALGPMGCLLLALGLLGKEPGQTAIAVDALVQAHGDGRLDAQALGGILRDLFATPMPKAARLRASLAAATRADASLRRPVFEVLAAVVTADPSPRELATLLDLMLELKLGLDLTLSPITREALAKINLTGRSKALQKSLLA